MKKVAAVKANDADIDWAAEFGEDDEFTVDENPEHDEEVEIVLKHNRDNGAGTAAPASSGISSTKSPLSPTYSVRNGDVRQTSSMAAKAPMSIGKSSPQLSSDQRAPSSTLASSMSASTTMSAGDSMSYSPASSMTSSTTATSTHRFEPPMPRIDLDTHHVVAPSPYNAYIEIRTMAATIKIISLVHLMLCLVYILLPSFKWMIFPNLGVAAVGLWAAFVYNARLTVAFMTLVCLNIILLIAFMLLEMLNNTIPSSIIVIGVLCLIGEIFIMNYCYQFWKKLPSEGFFAGFRQFFSSNEPRIGGFVMTDEEEGL